MTAITLGILVLIFFAALVAGFVAVVQQNRSKFGQHPSELSASARAILRPLRQAIESFESAFAATPAGESRILAGPARESVQHSLKEAERLAALRDEYLEIIRRAKQSGRDTAEAQRAVDTIENQIADATAAIDRITLRISRPTSEIAATEVESDLPSLIANLENLGSSYDELKQTEQIHTEQ